MPPRWLSSKTRVSHDENRVLPTQPGKVETIKTSKWDDFCFVDEAVPPINATQEGDRPKTSSGVSGRNRSKSRTRPQIGLTLARPKTSEGRPLSTDDASYSRSKSEEDMIGVAFGSPTHPPATIFGTLNDLAPPSTYEESLFEQAEPMHQIRGRTSKWRKLGSLFKGGKAATDKDDTFEVPFYKLRIEGDPPEPEVDVRARKYANAAVELPISQSPTPPPKDNPRRSIDERLAQARLEVARLEEAIREAEKKTADREEEASNDASRPKLDLVIPDIKMDRYSVMFADLKEIPPHSKLLARRSKKLDRLKPSSLEDMKQIDETATPDTSTLSPRLALPRRATSPSATKTTAGFSLFPAAALTPNHITRQALAIPLLQPQLKRSVTSPARLSPRAETFDAERTQTSHPPQADSATAVISPGDTTASTDRGAPWSADALLSPTSTVTTIEEDILLSPMRNHKNYEHEQQYPDANEAQHMQFLASLTLPQNTGETPEATTPLMSIDPSQEDDYKVRRVASSVFDAAIAEIEAFGIPSIQEQSPMPSPPSAYVPFVLAADESERKPVAIMEHPPPAISKSRLMMMNMPSPITEAPEESPTSSPARLIPVESRLVAATPLSEITALPRISESRRFAPPTPIKLGDTHVMKASGTHATRPAPVALASITPATSEHKPGSSPEKWKAQIEPSQRERKHEMKHEQKQEVQTLPRKREPKPETVQKERKQEQQTSPSRSAPRSNSRKRVNDIIERVLGEVIPASEYQKGIITERPTDAPRSPTDTPPAVPTKDSKFVLPLSRFAVKGTAAEVNKKSGLKASPRLPPPSKPVRSTTEPLTTEHMNKSYRKSNPSRVARSASDESLRREITNPVAKGTATSNIEGMGMERSKVTTVMAIVNPAPAASDGVFGVARTVSLSRKPSQRILVKRSDSTRDISPEGRLEHAKKLQERNQHQQPSLQPPRSSSRPRGPMSNLKRSESFKRAIEVGMNDDEEGDMRSGELRARALSPEMRQVTTGLVVNGHKVMKSSVGVIEEA